MHINLFAQRSGLHLDNLSGAFKVNQTDSKIKRLILGPFLAVKDRVYLAMRPFTKEEQSTVKQQVARTAKSIASGIKKTAEVSKAKLSRGAKSAKYFVEKNQSTVIKLTTIATIAVGLIYRSHEKSGFKRPLPEKKVSQNPSDLRSFTVAMTSVLFSGFVSFFLGDRIPQSRVDTKPKVEEPTGPDKQKTGPITFIRSKLRKIGSK